MSKLTIILCGIFLFSAAFVDGVKKNSYGEFEPPSPNQIAAIVWHGHQKGHTHLIEIDNDDGEDWIVKIMNKITEEAVGHVKSSENVTSDEKSSVIKECDESIRATYGLLFLTYAHFEISGWSKIVRQKAYNIFKDAVKVLENIRKLISKMETMIASENDWQWIYRNMPIKCNKQIVDSVVKILRYAAFAFDKLDGSIDGNLHFGTLE